MTMALQTTVAAVVDRKAAIADEEGVAAATTAVAATAATVANAAEEVKVVVVVVVPAMAMPAATVPKAQTTWRSQMRKPTWQAARQSNGERKANYIYGRPSNARLGGQRWSPVSPHVRHTAA